MQRFESAIGFGDMIIGTHLELAKCPPREWALVIWNQKK